MKNIVYPKHDAKNPNTNKHCRPTVWFILISLNK